MLLFQRPDKPDDFDTIVVGAKQKIEDIITQNQTPMSKDFDDVWRRYKGIFSTAQHGKCGFCEHLEAAGNWGDVEHFHPKTEVEELIEGSVMVLEDGEPRPRATRRIAERGYHWLAYDWDNYLFACAKCNRKYKRCLFPVVENPRQCPPDPSVHEEPLLLSCYGTRRPSKHLRFLRDGAVEAFEGSPYGHATIQSCELDRFRLRQARKDKATRAYDYAQFLFEDIDIARWKEIMTDLRRMGADDEPFAGMVRAIIEQECGVPWEDLMASA